MNFVVRAIAQTPLWVWLLLGYLVWQGIKAMQPRTTTIWRALIVPTIFIIGGLSRIDFNQQPTIWPLAAWAIAALALLPVGILTPRLFKVDHATGLISRPGSVFPLIRNVTVFALQYAVAVSAATHAYNHPIGTIIGRAISGSTSGYFIGSAIAILRKYRQRNCGAGARNRS